MPFKIKLLFILAFLFGCAAPRTIYDRGYNKQERIEFIKYNFTDIDDTLKQAFVDGRLTPGLPKQMVMDLVGPCDNSFTDNIWYFTLFNNRQGYIKFLNGNLLEVSEEIKSNPRVDN
jgi:hypothetical protein